MTIDEFPGAAPRRSLWLVTLADLALLLVGFFVLLQATQHLDRKALAAGLRQGFGAAAVPRPIPVAAAAMLNFAPGSATLPASAAGLAAWAREALTDPRIRLTVTGTAAGDADVDPATGSAAVLAADRARAVAVALAAAGIATDRLTIINADRTKAGRRQVVVTVGFAGERSIR